MAASFDKPFLDYDDLINLMISRGILVFNRSFAKEALSSLSYYTLVNGYKDTFLSIGGTDHFIDGTTFEELYSLYQIDSSINSILLKYILRIEHSLKSRVSYTVAESFGVYTDLNDTTNRNSADYLFRGNYSNSTHKRNNTLLSIKQRATGFNASDSVKYYIKNHNHVPPWILTTTLSFGNCIYWYRILKPKQKDYVTNEFIHGPMDITDKKAFLNDCFDLLRFFRNRIAHGHKVFDLRWSGALPASQYLRLSPPLVTSKDISANAYSTSGLFAVISVLLIILDTYGKRQLASELSSVIEPYNERNIRIAGKNIFDIFHLPDDFFIRIFNFLKTI